MLVSECNHCTCNLKQMLYPARNSQPKTDIKLTIPISFASGDRNGGGTAVQPYVQHCDPVTAEPSRFGTLDGLLSNETVIGLTNH
jgi:hypothetical protein